MLATPKKIRGRNGQNRGDIGQRSGERKKKCLRVKEMKVEKRKKREEREEKGQRRVFHGDEPRNAFSNDL